MKLAKLTVTATALLSTTAMADWSANVGIVLIIISVVSTTESASALQVLIMKMVDFMPVFGRLK